MKFTLEIEIAVFAGRDELIPPFRRLLHFPFSILNSPNEKSSLNKVQRAFLICAYFFSVFAKLSLRVTMRLKRPLSRSLQ